MENRIHLFLLIILTFSVSNAETKNSISKYNEFYRFKLNVLVREKEENGFRYFLQEIPLSLGVQQKYIELIVEDLAQNKYTGKEGNVYADIRATCTIELVGSSRELIIHYGGGFFFLGGSRSLSDSFTSQRICRALLEDLDDLSETSVFREIIANDLKRSQEGVGREWH